MPCNSRPAAHGGARKSIRNWNITTSAPRCAPGHIAEYGRLWPTDIYPAYLKLEGDEYELLDDFLNQHTERIWQDKEVGTCELRNIIIPKSP